MSFNKVLFAIFVGSVFLLPYIFSNYTVPTKAILGDKIQSDSSKNILFVSDKTGNQDIYRMDLETKKTENLTNNPANDMNPQVSPDGRFIVFYANRHGDNDIYRMNLKDLTVTQLTKDSSDEYDPAYSPDGQKIVYKSTRGDKLGDIFIMNADGTHPTNITPKKNTTEEWSPKFSNDGKKIFFVSRKDSSLSDEIYDMNTDGSGITRLTNNNVPDWYPAINPKNNAILFISRTNSAAKDDLFVMDTNKKIRQLTKLPGNDNDPSWDTSGNKIIFINDQDGNYDLYLMNADGSNIQRIEKTSDDELSPIFLP
jgi:TolB protein